MKCQPLVGDDGRVMGFACGGRREEPKKYVYPGPCPYCGDRVVRKQSQVVYGLGRDYGWLYTCASYPKCDAYVGCHPGSTRPLGRLADPELRKWKNAAHAAFDPLWKRKMERDACSKNEARTAAYAWLSKMTGIVPDKCHIGMMDVTACQWVVEVCAPYQRS